MTVLLEDLLKQTNIPHPDSAQLFELLQDNDKPITNKAFLDLYGDVQGNIVKSHGRNLSVHLFVEFKSQNIDRAKEWISNFAQKFVASVTKQRELTNLFKKSMRLKPEDESLQDALFANFFLSAKGYQTLLGWDDKKLKDCFKDRTFTTGMKNQKDLNDPPLDNWEDGLGKKNIHALILLASDCCDSLISHATRVEGEIKKFADIVHSEFGKVFRNENCKPVEHFGFIDGISQPLFFQEDVDNYIKKDSIDKWDPSAKLELVLVKDPLNPNKKYSCGSYLVYRKLQQDVVCFKNKIEELAKKLGVEPSLAEALVMGRFRDGTPVTLYNRALSPKKIPNNFDYQGDIHGTRCPFHAHIRKTNPRGEKITGKDQEQRDKRIARRGISYSYSKGTSSWSTETQLKYLQQASIDTPEKDVGLLFMCFQSSITNQFVTLQQTWANNTHFPKEDTGIDPVIGQGEQLGGGQYWPKNKDGWDENHKGRFDFSKCVQMKGGEYFFAPSISFLIDLPNYKQSLSEPTQT
jgi:Dyp-type peroxidase family